MDENGYRSFYLRFKIAGDTTLTTSGYDLEWSLYDACEKYREMLSQGYCFEWCQVWTLRHSLDFDEEFQYTVL